MYIYTQYKYIYIYTCTYNLLLWDKAWSLTDGRKATSVEKRFRFGETRRDNYLESGGTAGTGGEKDATHSVAEAGQA